MEFNTVQAAQALGVSKWRIRQFAQADRLRGRKVGRAWLFERREIARFARIPRHTGWPKGRKRSLAGTTPQAGT